ncbi:uncharacterized protein LOC115232532 [Argonauta hians]
MTMVNDSCHKRLQDIQEKFHVMEEMVSSMLHYKSKVEQLRQERFNLSVTYEENLQQYRLQVSKLERENMMLLNDYKKLQSQCYSSELHESSPQQLLEQINVLESNNSYLQQENEQQRKEYEKYMEEIANQVVQAVLVQKGLKQECCQLQERVHDLEVQNKQLNLLFQHHFLIPNESTTKLPCYETYVTTDGKEVKMDGRQVSLLDLASSTGIMFDKGAESLQSLCSHYCYEDGIPRIGSPSPWLKDQLSEHSDRINAFSDRLSILSDHVLEAQLKAYSTDRLTSTDLLSPSSSPPVRQAFLNSCLKSYHYDSNTKIWKANQSCDNFKSKLYATVRPLNCGKTFPSITVTDANRAATACLLHDHNSWKRNFVKSNNYSSYKNHLVGIKPCRESRRSPDSILHSDYFAQLSPTDILENSLDGLPTPTEEPSVQSTFPVFKVESLRHKQSKTLEKKSNVEKLPEAAVSQTSHQTSSKKFVEEPVPSNTIPTIIRPSSLDIISPTDSPSQEDSQTSPLSPYLMNKNESSMMNQSTDSENSPGMSASATFDHHNLVSSSYLDSTEDEKDLFDEKRSSLNSDYFSLDAQLSTSSYMTSLAPFHNDCQSNTEILPLYSSNHSKSRHIHNNKSKKSQTNIEQEKDWNVLMPTVLNKRTLPDIYLACDQWQKNVAKSMKENDMSTELREMYSLSSDSSSESIKAEHSANKDDGYSTMSSDMQPEILDKFSDSVMLKRDRINRNSIPEVSTIGSGSTLSKLVETEKNNSSEKCVSTSDNSAEGSTQTSGKLHSSKLFSLKKVPEKEQSVPLKSFNHCFNSSLAHIDNNEDNKCTNTFPKCHYLSARNKFSCASLPKQIGKSPLLTRQSAIPCLYSKSTCLNVSQKEAKMLKSPIVTEPNSSCNNPDNTGQDTSSDHCLVSSQTQLPPHHHLKRSVSDSRLLLPTSHKLRIDPIFSSNFNSSMSDCTISMSDLSSSQTAQSYQLLSGSLHRSPWQPLVPPTTDQTDMTSSDSSWSYQTSVLKKKLPSYNENGKATDDPQNGKSIKAAPLITKQNSVEKEKLLSIPPRPPPHTQECSAGQSAEEWLLQFTKEDIEKNLSYFKNRQKASHSPHPSMTPLWEQNADHNNMICWQTLQHRQTPHGLQASRYMTLPVTNISQESFETDDIDVNNLMSPKEIEEQKKFRQEFYSLCSVDSNRSLFSGSNNECEAESQSLKNIPSNSDTTTCHDICQSNHVEFDTVSLRIDNLSKTVKELQSSFSSLNSVECNSDIDSDIFNPSGHSSSVEGYHWVEDEFYLTPSSGDVIFTSCPSNESSASCDWMNEYADDSSGAFELKDPCEDDQQFLQKLCAVANLSMDSSKGHGGQEKLSTPDQDISDILVMNPETRADMLDSMIDINTPDDSEDSSNDEQLPVQMFKHRKARQKHINRANAQASFHNLFTRFGHQEKEAVSAFDFLDQFSTSSTNSETIMPDNNSEDLLTELSPVSHSSKATDISPTGPNRFCEPRKSQLLSKKAWKQSDSSSHSSLARVTAIELMGNCSGDSLDSPEDGISASTLSLSDSCCES